MGLAGKNRAGMRVSLVEVGGVLVGLEAEMGRDRVRRGAMAVAEVVRRWAASRKMKDPRNFDTNGRALRWLRAPWSMSLTCLGEEKNDVMTRDVTAPVGHYGP